MTAEKKVFKTDADFRKSLEARLLMKSRSKNIGLQILRQQVAFERFLARLFASKSSPWVLKGGHAMELRLNVARATQDIDLFFKTNSLYSDQKLILSKLQEDCGEIFSDFFYFRVRPPLKELEGPPYGGYRFPIESIVASRTFVKFHIDVGLGDICLEPFEQIQGKGCLDFFGINPPVYQVISREQQFAEKVHAYTFTYQNRVNSRVKDLIDMALLIEQKQMKGEELLSALKQTFHRRATHDLPEKLAAPPQEWTKTFSELAKQCLLKKNMDEIHSLVSNFYRQIVFTNTHLS